MAHPLLMALFGDSGAAARAARDLRARGVPREDLSVVAADHQTEGDIADEVGGSPGSEIEDSRPAGRLGELSGLILGAIAVGMPGTGALVAAGPLAAELGEAAGHVAGDLTETLLKSGLSKDEAAQWKTQIQSGAVLLGVHARAVAVGEVEAAFSRSGVKQIIRTNWEDR